MKAYIALIMTVATLALPTGGVAKTQRAEPIDGNATRAKLLPSGKLRPPKAAPRRVKMAIVAANRIADKPYLWGGGHGSWRSPGYDCSGAVSFALRGGRFLDSPLTSGGLSTWGRRGEGDWITVYANHEHVYAVIAGFRWDTSGAPGPRWHRSHAPRSGFTKRHPTSF